MLLRSKPGSSSIFHHLRVVYLLSCGEGTSSPFIHLRSRAGDGPVSTCRSRLSLTSIHCSLTMRWWMQVASMEYPRCAEGVPDRSSSSRARARSSRTGCGSAIAFIGWSCQDLPTEPDLDPSRTGGRGRFIQQRVGRHSSGAACPRMPRTEGQGSGKGPHDRYIRAGLDGGAVAPFDSARETADP
jgi:hypothetical protein